MAQLSKERLRRYAEELGENVHSDLYVRIPFLKLNVGQTKVRVLPGQEPSSIDKDFYVKSIICYHVNPNNPRIPVVSPKTKDPSAPCPIHDKYFKLRGSDDPADQAQAKLIAPKTYFYMCVLMLDGPDAGKIKVLQGRKTLWKKIMALMSDSEYGDITDPIKGFDIRIVKSGKELDTEYDVIPARMPTPISEDADEVADILANQFDLWRFREAPSIGEIKKFMAGEITRFTTGGFAIAKPIVEEADEEEDEERAVQVEDDDPVVPPPAIKKAKPSITVDDDDDEEPVAVAATPKPGKRFGNLDDIRKKLRS